MPQPSEATPCPTVIATVEAELHKRLYRLITADGTTLIAGLSAEAKRLGVAIATGSKVEARRASLDPGRATILGPFVPPPARRT